MRERRPHFELGSDSPDGASIDVYGRDEMNLAEFPIAALTDYVPRGCNTIQFSDGSGSLMVTGSDAYGLPTAADADVVVALIQLTKRRNGFQSPAVHFSRAELLEILGWPESGKSYRRLTESLMRWSTTSLKYEGTWWDQRSRRKINAVFHILNEVVLFDRSGPVDGESGQPPQSYFAWNKVFLSSCQAGNLKRLDLGMYFALEHASSKRLYRFLDKRLYRQPDQTFDLAEVAFERVGLSRAYVGKKGAINVAKVREKLRPAIDELETGGFLIPLSPEERYRKHEDGWVIRFARTGEAKADEAEPGAIPLQANGAASPSARVAEDPAIAGLIHRGVTRARAEDLARRHPSARIAEKLEIFDWKLAKYPAGMKRNPAGWLVKAVEDDYPAPRGFESQAAREALFERGREAAEEARRARAEARRLDRDIQAVDDFLARLAPDERAALEAEAIAAATENARHDLEAATLPTSIRKALRLALVREHVAAKRDRGDEVPSHGPTTTAKDRQFPNFPRS
jgi:hypothetical protein